MRQQYKTRLKGKVQIDYYEHNKLTKRENKNNAILPSAQFIVASALANIPNSQPNEIEIFNGLVSLSLRPIISTQLILNSIIYSATFEMTSFNGSFDRIILRNNAIGDFSELNLSPSLTKSVSEQITIVWTIDVIF